ncbi:MAG: type II CAAX endopeptidase family protein [Robiginitomaculum sp.]
MNKQSKSRVLYPFADHAYTEIPQKARLLRRFPGWVWAILSIVIIVALIIITQGASLIIALIPILAIGEKLSGDWLLYFSLYGLIATFPIVVIWVKFVENRPLSTMGVTKTRFVPRYARGFLFGILSVAVSVGIATLLGGYEIESIAPAFKSASALGFAAFFLFGFIIQGASEEFVSRGWHLSAVTARSGVVVAILINALFFGVMHLGNIEQINWLAIFNLVLFGVFISFYALTEQSLAGVCGLHSSWNWFLGTGIGLEVSGFKLPGEPWLVDLNPIGSDLLTGGAFGPEGSIIETVILSVLSVYTYTLYRKRKRQYRA